MYGAPRGSVNYPSSSCKIVKKYKCKNYLQVRYQKALKNKKVCSTSLLVF